MAESLLPPVVVHLLADIKEFQAKMGEAKGEMDTLSAKGAATGTMVMKGLGMATLGVAGLAAGIAGIGIASAMSYQDAMAKVGGQLGLTEDKTKKLGDQFFKTARGSEYSATDLAKAYAGVAGQVAGLQGGSDVAAASTEVLKSAMELATAKGISLDSAVSNVVGTMRTFQMPAEAAGDAMAILYNTSSATGLSVDTLNSTLGRMNAAVVGVKPSASDLAGLLVDLGQHGVTGSRAITSVSGSITKMLNPAFQAKAAAAGLNLQVYDTNGNFVGMRNVIAQLQPQLAGLSQQQQIATLSNAGLGSSAEKLLPTILAGTGAFDKATTAVKNQNKAQQASDAAGKTFKGNLEKVKAAAQDAATSLGNVLLPDATKALGWLAGPGADHLRHFINGLEGKGHSKDPAHQLGVNIKNMATDIANAFKTMKAVWDTLPTPLKQILGAAVAGAAVGGKVAGPEGAAAGAVVAGGSAALTVNPKVDKNAPTWQKWVSSGLSALQNTGPLRWMWDYSKGALGLLNDIFGGSPAGAAEHKPKGGGAGGGVQATSAAISGSLIAIATNTAGAATTLQTSDGRLERHGQHLEKIDTMSDFTSQHTREANRHLISISNAVRKTDKVNIKVRLV